MYYECRHITPNGRRCHCAALSDKPYCYFHFKLHALKNAPRPKRRIHSYSPSSRTAPRSSSPSPRFSMRSVPPESTPAPPASSSMASNSSHKTSIGRWTSFLTTGLCTS